MPFVSKTDARVHNNRVVVAKLHVKGEAQAPPMSFATISRVIGRVVVLESSCTSRSPAASARLRSAGRLDEQAASASEELTAQALQLRGVVSDLLKRYIDLLFEV